MLSLLLLFPVPARAAAPQGVPAELQERINRAIDRGAEFLIDTQLLDGSWEYLPEEYLGGHTALAAYTLMKCGVAAGHPSVRRALAYLEAHPPEKTYALSCALLALRAAADPGRRAWVEALAKKLQACQTGGGLFRYPDHPENLPEDLSNSLFAALGLRAAADAGVKVPPKVWEKLIDAAQTCQENEETAAGFRYRPGEPAYGSMTTAGVTILALAMEQLGTRLGAGNRKEVERDIERGVAWLARHFSVAENPRHQPFKWHYYFLYGVERVGSLLEAEKIGDHDWYRAGAEYLVMEQKPWGGWQPAGEAAEVEVDTCLALLFLTRATARAATTGAPSVKVERLYGHDDPAAPVSLKASGDTPLTLWISMFGAEELRRCAWPEDQGRGLRVRRVEYYGRLLGDGGGAALLLGTVEQEAGVPHGTERFALQRELPAAGRWALEARVHVLLSPAGQEEVLRSPELAVRIEDVLEAWRLDYAADGARNLLAGVEVAATASSQDSEAWPARAAFDNQMSRGWLCRAGEREPWIAAELEKAVKAEVLLLSHARAKRADRTSPRAAKLQLTINGRDSLEVVMDPDNGRKTRVELPGAVSVKKIELRILSLHDGGQLGRDAVGFAEVELQRKK